MGAAETTATPTYEPPGPGTWEIDAVHFPRPATRYWAEMHPEPFKRGFGEFCAFYGMLIKGREMQYVNGFVYGTVRSGRHRGVPERFERAAETFEHKLWREQLRDWDENLKPASIASTGELQSVDPDALSDEELAAYLAQCRDHHAAMIYQHMRFTGGSMLPTGDFLAHVGDWTGLAPAEVLDVMRGAAPVSAGASGELERLTAALAAGRRGARALASDGDPGEVLAALRSRDDETGRAMKDYLDLVGYRLLDGFDISGPARDRAARLAAAGDPRRRRGRWPPRTPTSSGKTAEIRAQGARGVPCRVRRTARRGAGDVPPARRARRVQRHLGLGDHAPRRTRRRPAAGRRRAASRAAALHRRRLRRDAGAAGRSRRAVRRRARPAVRGPHVAHRQGRAARARRRTDRRRRTRPACRPRRRG